MNPANKYDVIQWIGNKACAAGTEVTRMLVDQPHCTAAEASNMGALVLIGIVVAVGVVMFARSRQAHRDDYLR